MSDTPTRAHVASPTPIPHIPVADREIPQSTPPSDDNLTSNPTIIATIPLSRKEKRKQKHTRHDSAFSTPIPSDTDSDTPHRKPPNNPPKSKNHTTSLLPRSMPAAKNAVQTAYPLLICSLGNPGSTYANTLHSAGHMVTSYIASRKAYKPFQKGLSGLVARPDTMHMSFGILQGFRRVEGAPIGVDEDWTMWQSTSMMNVSGRGVGRAYNEWLRGIRAQYGDSAIEGRLVVVHDELESALGKVTIKDGGASARGHNGLKSCQASLGGVKWWRVGVGIGRPESREPDVVAKYVLRKATGMERDKLEGSAIGVVKALEEIAAGQR
ncbi:peptidyl-tRNA hydrolase-domain-containing protein [Paraphoma chrysanthemicola]|uniref:peptidyl-tRNA hydrolase n=1 Tax=Paraphoma chrysanthemicola TaxID=798071 RepID=A0A8K0VYR9_9PLEO|nr:peptidyl-tRNA hydrolase-domain-containing protein [Paraphoma chrysanthemicola]